jgi:D-arabinose 1-dehydrogenase-like Zn-dependent alcohol dehydrogenase
MSMTDTAWGGICRGDPKPGETIAVVGLGGIGHLGVQYAVVNGFRTVVVTKTESKSNLAKKLGASAVVKDGAALREAGGADILLATSSSNEAVLDAMGGLKPSGRVILIGIGFDSFTIPTQPLVMNSWRVIGSAHNGKQYLMQALDMAAEGKVKTMTEVFPKDRIQEAADKQAKGEIRFKAVITYD